MRTLIRGATLVATAFTLCSAPAALAATGGGTSTASAAQAPATAGAAPTAPAALQTVAVKLTRTQTKSVQRRVRVKPDGALGTRTRKAIRTYQRVKSLTLTGRPNIETLRTMGLKIADKLEARLLAEQTSGTAVAAPAGTVAATLAAAREAIGTPYMTAGTTLRGFDCSGFTLWAFGKAGVKLPRTSFDQYREGVAVEQDAIAPGDLVFFNSAGAGASHVGIATGPNTVISSTTRGVMEHKISDGYWGSHYVGARRLTDAA